MGGIVSKKVKTKTNPFPELKFQLNRLSGDGFHYKTFIASVSKEGRYADYVLRTPDYTVNVYYHDKNIVTKLLEEILAKALADGSVSVSINYRPAGTQSDAYTLKNMKELMEIVVDNIGVMGYINKIVLQPRLTG